MSRKARWDARYADGDRVDAPHPAEILADAEPWLPAEPGVALDLACGAGRNSRWLAERGWRVLAVDISRRGLRRLQARPVEAGRVLPVQAELPALGLRSASVDLVLDTLFLLRDSFPLIRTALRPGGLLAFETYSTDELDVLGGDIRREYCVRRGELEVAFGDWEVLLHEEGVVEREEGERGLARLIARKPPAP